MNDEQVKCYVKVYLEGQVPVTREITQFPCRIGRVEDNDIVIPESSVSSHHATLTEAEGMVSLEDQWSTNGVYLDGNRIGHADVTRPMRIILGRVTADFAPTEEGLDTLPPFAIPLPSPQPVAKPQPVPAEQAKTITVAAAPSPDEDQPQFQAVATTSRGKGVGKQGIVCPHCWHRFDVSEFLFIARHQSLTGDPVLGADAQQRFLPTRFTTEGNAIDAAGMSCPDMACPRCHLRIPQAASEMLPLFLSIVGAPAAGKSYFLTAMTWELRRTLPRNFAISFTDTDAVNNHILNEFEEMIFLPPDTDAPAALRKTELQGELYNQVLLDNMLINLPKPFMFTITPEPHHPRFDEVRASMSRTLVLYDNAGEHFEPGMDSVDNPTTQHLLQSDTIFFLFDPTKDSRFRKRLQNVEDPQLNTKAKVQRQEIILTEMINRIKKYSGIKSSAKTAKKLLFLVSKFDVWKHLLDFEVPAEPWRWEKSCNTSALDIDAIQNVSFSVRHLLDSICPEIVATAESFAGEVLYFPNSAIGHSPELDPDSGVLAIRPRDVAPFWVSVPMLYYFYERGFIPSIPENARERHPEAPAEIHRSRDVFFVTLPGVPGHLEIPVSFAGFQLRCPETDLWFTLPKSPQA